MAAETKQKVTKLAKSVDNIFYIKYDFYNLIFLQKKEKR